MFSGKTPLSPHPAGSDAHTDRPAGPHVGEGGTEGACCSPWSAPKCDHHSKDRTGGMISSIWDARKRNRLQQLIPEVCFSRLGGFRKGLASSFCLLCWEEDSSSSSTPFSWPVSAPAKITLLIIPAQCVSMPMRGGPLPLSGRGWDKSSVPSHANVSNIMLTIQEVLTLYLSRQEPGITQWSHQETKSGSKKLPPISMTPLQTLGPMSSV